LEALLITQLLEMSQSTWMKVVSSVYVAAVAAALYTTDQRVIALENEQSALYLKINQ
jgi:hypothetical protein